MFITETYLKEGIDALLVEANEIGQSASGRNGGFCTPGWALSDQKISDLVGTNMLHEKLNQFSIEGLPIGWRKAFCFRRL